MAVVSNHMNLLHYDVENRFRLEENKHLCDALPNVNVCVCVMLVKVAELIILLTIRRAL